MFNILFINILIMSHYEPTPFPFIPGDAEAQLFQQDIESFYDAQLQQELDQFDSVWNED